MFGFNEQLLHSPEFGSGKMFKTFLLLMVNQDGDWKIVDRNELKKNTDWLPPGWIIKSKERTNGNSSGRVDYVSLILNPTLILF
ncbi:hypothetical protein AQUCO_02800002v1 [Aquilegia coerulea]|uniref:Uncharacterized protein n=1 Tax=Aquilegia coerulea TaxID=218851 RepID=A0A2G5D3K2_AQUCA|nr:hypothetical protein AQUCO_02800002v1 [Aquilegia coerulea]